jgi:microsomal dipeptidase-like Zn-dependent dipeptidase
MLIRELGEMGANEADVDKITGGNILRVLENGWGSI